MASTTADTIQSILNVAKEAGGAPPSRKRQRKTEAKSAAAATVTPAKKQQQLAPSPLSHALSTVAVEVYLRLDEATFKACRPAEVKPKPKRMPVGGYATWRPKGSLFFTLVKASNDTVVFCHSNGTAYHAAPAARLACDCPDQTAFLCQWCVDKDPKTGHQLPRLLVFDVLDAHGGGAAARGERLRGLAKCLPQPLCVVQWAGDHKVLEEFIKGGLPHPVDCIVGLSEDDPLKLYRRMRVDIPKLPPMQFHEHRAKK
jgi:hypothetical protein